MIVTAVHVSDTHGWLHKINDVGMLPDADLLIHTGDMSIWSPDPQHQEELYKDLQCLEENQHRFKHMIIVPGNHDEAIQQQNPAVMAIINRIPNLHLLIDELLVLEEFHGLRIYGSPWIPKYTRPTFALSFTENVRSEELQKKRDLIPDVVDILATHTPPERSVDSVGGYNVGCSLLREKCAKVKPTLHVCGHVHGANGAMPIGEENPRYVINSAICNMALEPFHEPHFIEMFCEQDEPFMILTVQKVKPRSYFIKDHQER